MGDWIRANWLKWWRCWLRPHRWRYFGYTPLDWRRACEACGRHEKVIYDISTGTTFWRRVPRR